MSIPTVSITKYQKMKEERDFWKKRTHEVVLEMARTTRYFMGGSYEQSQFRKSVLSNVEFMVIGALGMGLLILLLNYV